MDENITKWWLKIQMSLLLLLSAALWTYKLVLRHLPGKERLVWAVPVILLHYGLPLIFDYDNDPFTIMAVSYFSFRMSTSKV